MSGTPVIKGHTSDCSCWESVEQRKFDTRVSAHIRDPNTLFVAGFLAGVPALLLSLVVGALVWWTLGSRHVMTASMLTGVLTYVLAFGFAFYSVVLNAPLHSGYTKPGSQRVDGENQKLIESGTFQGLPRMSSADDRQPCDDTGLVMMRLPMDATPGDPGYGQRYPAVVISTPSGDKL